MNINNPTTQSALKPSEDYVRAVTNSALWAAAGDALGWITELSGGQAGVKRRIGASKVTKPVSWTRMVGGRGGVKIDLPAGTYSDDTQLRLAVSRSIRGDGTFDVETFAKIEITVWPTYALGGGLGTKAAALNLSRRGVNWFSNFYERGVQSYITGGGNGAAMRIQPHVWASRGNIDEMLLNVLRDAIVTHGHPHGFCGAVFHALALRDIGLTRNIPDPNKWKVYIEQFEYLSELITNDHQLSAFWRPAWEKKTGHSLEYALLTAQSEAMHDYEIVYKLLDANRADYHAILSGLQCLTDRFRGSGFKTALAASALAFIYKDNTVEQALVCAANELDSDTDTIASMAGALLGMLSPRAPIWEIQDRDYIVYEAARTAAIAYKQPQQSFSYPDLGRWNPPVSQSTSVGKLDDKLFIAGLGSLDVRSREYSTTDAVWQWFELPFGQTILAKRKAKLTNSIEKGQLPEQRKLSIPSRQLVLEELGASATLPYLPFIQFDTKKNAGNSEPSRDRGDFRSSIDKSTDEVIASEFDNLVLGELLNRCIDSSQSVESAIAFASIIAKAKLARMKKHR